jgi:hypothetical protein
MSSSLLKTIRSRDKATFAARSARSLHDARIENLDGRNVSAQAATSSSGNEATQRPSIFRFRESIKT